MREKERLTSDLQVSSKNLSELKCVNGKLEDKVKTLTCELKMSSTQLQSFMSGTKKLDNLLGMNKPAGNRQGLRFVKSDSNITSSSKATFVPTSNNSSNSINLESKTKSVTKLNGTRDHKISTPKFQHQQSLAFEPRFIPTYNHCHTLGHTRPRCHKLANRNRSQDIRSQVNFLSNQVSHLTEMAIKLTRITSTSRKVWVKKSDVGRYGENSNCFVAHVAYEAQNISMWYLNSTCSRHMCGNKALFSTFDECNDGVVTFGNRATTTICGKGTINISGFPTISNVLYVEGLKSNLLSINQICDTDYEVSFVQKRCTVYDFSGGVVLEGVRTFYNCYGILPNSNYVCSSAKIDMTELWHKNSAMLTIKVCQNWSKRKLLMVYLKLNKIKVLCVSHVKKENNLK